MTKKIETLTPEQEALLPQVRDEWIAHGLSTQPANRAAAEDGVRLAYQAAGLEPPPFMIWVDSPYAGAWAQAIAPFYVGAGLKVLAGEPIPAKPGSAAQVRDQVGDQVRDQVWAQVRAQVGAQVWDQVRDQVRAQVGDQVGDQVRDQVRAQVGDQVWDQVRDQVGDQVWDQVRDQVWDQVGDQVGAQVGDQVWDQVRDQVGDQVWDQVGAQVRKFLGDWSRGLIYDYYEIVYSAWFHAMRELGVEGMAMWDGHAAVGRNAYWWWAFRDYAILTERPTALHRDPLGRLHCETGPAMAWPDGWGFHAWHGTRVPADLIERGWTTDEIFAEANAEIRRCAIERMGWDEFIIAAGLERVGAPVPDPGNPGFHLALYDVPERIFDEPVRVLLCANATPERDGTRRRFGLTVPDTCRDPIEAAAWTFNTTPQIYQQLNRAC